MTIYLEVGNTVDINQHTGPGKHDCIGNKGKVEQIADETQKEIIRCIVCGSTEVMLQFVQE